MSPSQTRRQFLGTVPPTALLASSWGSDILDSIFSDTDVAEVRLYADDESNADDVPVAEDRLFLAADTGTILRPDDDNDEWVAIESTGNNPILESAVISELRTLNIGVSANQSSDLVVSSGSANESRLLIDDVSKPHFDSFDELDAEANKIVINHPSHHEISAHALLESAAATGQVIIRVFVNGIERLFAEGTTTTGKDMTASASKNLKLDKGDEIWATVEHDTGSDETFPGDRDGNYLSVVRQ